MNNIFVSKPYLPSRDQFNELVDQIWMSNSLTNNGPFINELESKIREYTSLNNLILNNGTTALNLAYKALDLYGKKVLTTPFSFIATSSTLLWDNIDFDFVDIDPKSFNICTVELEKRVSEDSSIKAFVFTHVFGNLCEVEEVDRIAKEHGIHVIYDAAHCFGVTYKERSAFAYGDISTCSYHATKLFHMNEGGGVFSGDADLLKKMELYRNFGFSNGEIIDVGINAKNSEMHAAMGLLVLKNVNDIIKERISLSEYYRSELSGFVQFQKIKDGVSWNASYMPVLLASEMKLLEVESKLNMINIFPRRYFYPSLDQLVFMNLNKKSCKVSRNIASRILCLPLYNGLEFKVCEKIVLIIKGCA